MNNLLHLVVLHNYFALTVIYFNLTYTHNIIKSYDKSLKTIRLSLIFQTCFDGTSVIVSVTIKITSVWLHNIAITSIRYARPRALIVGQIFARL